MSPFWAHGGANGVIHGEIHSSAAAELANFGAEGGVSDPWGSLQVAEQRQFLDLPRLSCSWSITLSTLHHEGGRVHYMLQGAHQLAWSRKVVLSGSSRKYLSRPSLMRMPVSRRICAAACQPTQRGQGCSMQGLWHNFHSDGAWESRLKQLYARPHSACH